MKLFFLKTQRYLLLIQIDNIKMLQRTRGVINPKLEKLELKLDKLDFEIWKLYDEDDSSE